ncbi:hypothetical protein N9L42_02500 [Flavobacteriaceae bacterium]|nr:hypothetical protein [Flavobacteriaceae bacterium]
MDFISKIKTHSSFHQLLTWFLSPKSIYLEDEEPWNINLFAQNICYLYKNLPFSDKNLVTSLITLPKYDERDYPKSDKNYLKPVRSLKSYIDKELEDYLTDFLIHGSISTADYSIGWSDFDTFVILKSQTFENHKTLIEFRSKIIKAHSFLLDIDALQHHGFIFCTEYGLDQYFSHFLPEQVLKNSKSLMGNTQIKIQSYREQNFSIAAFSNKNEILKSAYNKKILYHHKFQNKYLKEDFQDANTMYQLKYFLSIVMTLPVLYLDAIGEPCYKKDSFSKVKSKFINEWEIIDKASEIRTLWQIKEEFPYTSNRIPNWIIEILGGNYFSRAHKLSNKMFIDIGK